MQKPFSPKIIFFDIDNTLYLTEQQVIPKSTIKALSRLKQQGIMIAIATGRTLTVLPEAIQELIAQNGIDLVVAINGQLIQHQGKVLTSFPLAKQQVIALVNQLNQHHIAHALVSDNGIWVGLLNNNLREATASVAVSYHANQYCPEDQNVYQILAFYPEQLDNQIHAMLPETLKTVRWHRVGVDILPKNGSKARGIETALTTLGLQWHETMAFGDGLNDIEMIQAAGYGIAMGNSEPALKKVADYVCPKIDEDGIYRALVDLGVI